MSAQSVPLPGPRPVSPVGVLIFGIFVESAIVGLVASGRHSSSTWILAVPVTVLFLAQFTPATAILIQPAWTIRNVGLCAAWVHAIAVPLVAAVFGLSADLALHSRVQPGDAARGQLAVTLLVVGFLSALALVTRSPRTLPHQRYVGLPRVPALCWFGLAILGIALRLHSFGGFIGYLRGQIDPLALRSDSLWATVGLVATSIGGAGLIISTLVDIERNRFFCGRRVRLAMATKPVLALAFFSTFSFNRAAMLYPFIALLLTLSRRFPTRLPARTLVGLGAAAVLLMAIFSFRTGAQLQRHVSDGLLTHSQADEVLRRTDFITAIELYGVAPQLVGAGIRLRDAGPDWGRTLLADALSPVPIVGTPWRSSSATAELNRLIYGTQDVQDQVNPLALEWSWSYGVGGPFFGGMVLGALLVFAERRFSTATSVPVAYPWALMGVWLAAGLFSSLLVIVQGLLYFVLPSLVVSRFFKGKTKGARAA